MKHFLLLLFVIFTVAGPIACSEQDNKTASLKENIKTHAAIAAETKNFTLEGSCGKLVAILETPAVAPDKMCPLVILMHGLTSNKNDGLMVHMAALLKEQGIASIRFDFNGHGQSDGKFIDMTISKEKQDAIAVYNYARSLDFVSDIAILGHSQGGFVCTLVAAELKDKITAAVLLAPGGNIPLTVQAGVALLCGNDVSRIPKNGFPMFGRTLGHDYLADAFPIQPFEVAKEYTGPVCLIHGSADIVVPITISRQYNEAYQNKEFHTIQGDSHEFRKNFNQVCQLSLDFLVKHLKKDTTPVQK